jgi:hypothetical protein
MTVTLVTRGAELVGVLLLGILLAIDLWQSPPRRTLAAMTAAALLLGIAFLALVGARFVIIAG